MSESPRHEIKVTHNWRSPEPYKSGRSKSEKVQTCQVCGAEKHILALDSATDGSSWADLKSEIPANREKAWAEFRELNKAFTKFSKQLEDMESALFDGTEYQGLFDFAARMKSTYENAVSDGDITFGLAYEFLQAIHSSRKKRRKLLLAMKQGPVCNRCDSIYPLRLLTEDHIVPKERRGQAKLLNLQLLCLRCNQAKDNSEPSDQDQSPYAYKGQSCVHQITCQELEARYRTRESSVLAS